MTARQISVKLALQRADMSLDDCMDGSCPPVCSECSQDGHMVEPDGECPHGFPSVLIALGVI